MSVFNPPPNLPSNDRPKHFLIRVDVSNVGTSCKLTLWAKDTVISGGTGKWGIPVDPSGNLGVLANNVALPVNATYFFEVEDIGDFTEIVLVQNSNVGGTPVCTAEIAAWTDLVQDK